MDITLSSIFNENFTLMATRIFFALLLSGIIGFERESKNHSAGFRTHILVGVSACLMMLLSLYGFEEYILKYENVRFDPARIPSYVISGIGFLGAGTIIVNGVTIRGLTTAASIWAVAGLGLVVGAGMYGEAILTTVVILLSLIFLNNIEKRFHQRKSLVTFHIQVGSNFIMERLLQVIDEYEMKTKKLEIEKENGEHRTIFIELENDKKISKFHLFDRISKLNDVIQVGEQK